MLETLKTYSCDLQFTIVESKQNRNFKQIWKNVAKDKHI